eukprot:5249873-Pyramimonas_sp.AAC.1
MRRAVEICEQQPHPRDGLPHAHDEEQLRGPLLWRKLRHCMLCCACGNRGSQSRLERSDPREQSAGP